MWKNLERLFSRCSGSNEMPIINMNGFTAHEFYNFNMKEL